MKHLFKATVVTALLAASLSGCVVEEHRAHRPPPPAQVEVIPVAPSPGFHWVPGHWRWGERDWIWVPGHWRER
jgi:hypothetical protein